MIIVFNILTNESIEFEESFIRGHDNNFITLELPKGFDWLDHTRDCKDCGAFLKGIEDNSSSWIMQIDKEKWIIDLSTEFAGKENHFASHLSTSVTNGISQSWLKLRIRPVDKSFLEKNLKIEEDRENYERCAHLRDVIKKIPDKD